MHEFDVEQIPEDLLRFVLRKWAALAAVIETRHIRREASMLPAIIAQLSAILPGNERLVFYSSEGQSAEAASEQAWSEPQQQPQQQQPKPPLHQQPEEEDGPAVGDEAEEDDEEEEEHSDGDDEAHKGNQQQEQQDPQPRGSADVAATPAKPVNATGSPGSGGSKHGSHRGGSDISIGGGNATVEDMGQACGMHGRTDVTISKWDPKIRPGYRVSYTAAVIELKIGPLTVANITQAEAQAVIRAMTA